MMSGRFQSRYQHIDWGLTMIMPAKTLLSLGGRLKAVAVGHLAVDTCRIWPTNWPTGSA